VETLQKVITDHLSEAAIPDLLLVSVLEERQLHHPIQLAEAIHLSVNQSLMPPQRKAQHSSETNRADLLPLHSARSLLAFSYFHRSYF
jgi:hypothetical protein